MGHPLSPAAVEAVLDADAHDLPSPLHTDGLTVLRHTGPAGRVSLDLWAAGFPDPGDFTEVAPGVWAVAFPLPERGRLEYRISVDGDSRLDPLNPRRSSNPFGENSVAVGPGYRPPGWTLRPAQPGRLVEIRVTSEALGGRRHHHLYSPAGSLAATPLPLLVVHDGSDYRRFADLCRAVDVLLSRGRIRPIRLALLDPRRRHEEYVGAPAHAAHVVEEVLPHIARRVHVTEPLGIMGASLGAVAAWHTAWCHPGTFRRLLLQSGTYAFDPEEFLDPAMFSSIGGFVSRAAGGLRLDGARVFMTCGRYESLLGWNRRVAARFRAGGIEHRYRESWAGHDWGAWRDWLAPALRYLYAPGNLM